MYCELFKVLGCDTKFCPSYFIAWQDNPDANITSLVEIL